MPGFHLNALPLNSVVRQMEYYREAQPFNSFISLIIYDCGEHSECLRVGASDRVLVVAKRAQTGSKVPMEEDETERNGGGLGQRKCDTFIIHREASNIIH